MELKILHTEEGVAHVDFCTGELYRDDYPHCGIVKAAMAGLVIVILSRIKKSPVFFFSVEVNITSEFSGWFCFPCKGEKLQFVFRNISPSDQDSAYVVTMGIKEDGSYQSKLQPQKQVYIKNL